MDLIFKYMVITKIWNHIQNMNVLILIFHMSYIFCILWLPHYRESYPKTVFKSGNLWKSLLFPFGSHVTYNFDYLQDNVATTKCKKIYDIWNIRINTFIFCIWFHIFVITIFLKIKSKRSLMIFTLLISKKLSFYIWSLI